MTHAAPRPVYVFAADDGGPSLALRLALDARFGFERWTFTHGTTPGADHWTTATTTAYVLGVPSPRRAEWERSAPAPSDTCAGAESDGACDGSCELARDEIIAYLMATGWSRVPDDENDQDDDLPEWVREQWEHRAPRLDRRPSAESPFNDTYYVTVAVPRHAGWRRGDAAKTGADVARMLAFATHDRALDEAAIAREAWAFCRLGERPAVRAGFRTNDPEPSALRPRRTEDDWTALEDDADGE